MTRQTAANNPEQPDNAEQVQHTAPAPAPEPQKEEFIEFVGSQPHGTEFYKGEHGTHTLTAKQLKDAAGVDLGAKEVVWRRDASRGDRFLVPVSDVSPEAAEHLAKDPMFKRVSL